MPTTGTIIAVGEGVTCLNCEMSFLNHKEGNLCYSAGEDNKWQWNPKLWEGDMVLFPRVAGMDFTIAEADLRILHVNDILAVLVDTDGSVVEVKGSDVEEGVGDGAA